MDEITIGIDFGTTNTSVAYMKYNNQNDNYSPACFNLGKEDTIRTLITYKDENNFWVGDEALMHSYEYPRNFISSLKRKIVNDTLKDSIGLNKSESDIISDFLSNVLNRIDRQLPLNSRVGGVAIGIPIGFKDKHKDLYLKALVKAGVYDNYEIATKKTYFVSEPIAAVLDYNLTLRDNKRVLVFDFGGGTLDLVIMDLKNIKNFEISPHEVNSKIGNLSLGGDDFDKAILEDIVIEKYGLLNLKRNLGIHKLEDIYITQEGIELMKNIRWAKEQLSYYDKTSITFEKGNLSMSLGITREEYEQAIDQHLVKIRGLIFDCLSNAGFGTNDIDIVVLSGGSSLTPAVQSLLFGLFGKSKVKINGDAMTSIARGLAFRGKEPEGSKYNDIIEHSYGIKMKSEDELRDHIELIIKKGRKINEVNEAECYQEFELIKNIVNKNVFSLRIYEGNDEIAVAYIPLTQEMVHSKFKIYFSIDEKNQRLEMHIKDLNWDKKVNIPLEYKYISLAN